MCNSGSRHLYSLLVVSMELLHYYWIGEVVLTTPSQLFKLFKACSRKTVRNENGEYFFRFDIIKAKSF